MMKYIKSVDKSIIDYQPLSPFGKSYPRYYQEREALVIEIIARVFLFRCGDRCGIYNR